MNSHSYKHLLDVTHQEFVVIQGNTTEGGQGKQEDMKLRKSVYHSHVPDQPTIRGLMI